MKFHYINMLLFALPLNILVNTHKKTSITHHTPKIPTNRLLCECDLYMPNYDSDPEMKSVMDNFNKQTQQRLREYDDRMVEKRKQCKDKCDKESQKIILKDKIEKELMDKFVILQTDIQKDAIPTCVCEKSMADKTEKFCLNCGTNMGVAVPGLGVLGAYGAHSMVQTAITAGIDFATKAGIRAGTQAGIQAAIQGVTTEFFLNTLGGKTLEVVITSKTYNDTMLIFGPIMNEYVSMKNAGTLSENSIFSLINLTFENKPTMVIQTIKASANKVATNAAKVAAKVSAETTEALTMQNTAEATSATTILSNPIIISFIVVVIIVIILLIIYLILRYRRRKKMKKKLQYIKLLKE
ncbi:rifin PIR protein,putative [Plasmodium sp. DRC-Itaito]|nr:rifin PIR protein,putative [Plasmodium sp. DRC-Itaito]